jgi:glycosyltransferase involved in cell wall biosynthesis
MFLSIIIPTRNRAKYLERALVSIVAQTYSPEYFEVIIADNGSTDNTSEVYQAFKEKLHNLCYYNDPQPGLHVGRHLGLKKARGDILVYADDDIEAFPTWLEGIAEAFEDPQIALVGGKNLPKFEAEPPDWIKQMWKEDQHGNRELGYLSILDLGDKIKEISPFYVNGCNFSIRKSVLLEAGGFHPDGMPEELIRYRGDGERHISRFILGQGYKALYHPKASIYHLVPISRMTEDYFCKRAFNQGISDSYTNIRNGHKTKSWKMFLRKFKHGLQLSFGNKRTAKIKAAYCKGHEYHQQEVRKDTTLYEWVMKARYLDELNFRHSLSLYF